MCLRVLVADDSGFFRQRMTELLERDPKVRVVGWAGDGREAVAKATELRPDLVTMDVQMPVMDGIEATREIMRRRPTPVLMVSAITLAGARVTFRALEAGAIDFIPKSSVSQAYADPALARRLQQKVRVVGTRRLLRRANDEHLAASARPRPATGGAPRSGVDWRRFELMVIGASTGGPVALLEIARALAADFPLPIVVAQHMPPHFTQVLARRLGEVGGLAAGEAADGEFLRRGRLAVVPGGHQLAFRAGRDRGLQLRVRPAASGDLYRPSVDAVFASAASVLAAKVLAVVLTGMGRDGLQGARALKSAGAEVWVQDEASCVVYGMPKAVAEAGLADRVLSLQAVIDLLAGAAR